MIRIAPIVATIALAVFLFAGQAHSQQDIEPPQLLDVQFEPQVIDTSKGPQVITVTVHVTDDLSGVEWVTLGFYKPNTTQHLSIDIVPGTHWGNLLEGDNLDGYYQNTMTLPQYSAYGEWEMKYIVLIDNVKNRVDFQRPETEDEARNSNWPSLFNGFGFEVEDLSNPQQSPSLYLPLLGL